MIKNYELETRLPALFIQNVNVLVLTGFKGVGKDHLINMLKEDGVKLERLSFSDELRSISHEIFPWLPFEISVEEKDKVWEHPDNVQRLTPREIWKSIADDKTGVLYIQPDLLVEKFIENQLMKINPEETKLIVISDLRKREEFHLCQQLRSYCKQLRIMRITDNSDRFISGNFPDEVERHIPSFPVDILWQNNRSGWSDTIGVSAALWGFKDFCEEEQQ